MRKPAKWLYGEMQVEQNETWSKTNKTLSQEIEKEKKREMSNGEKEQMTEKRKSHFCVDIFDNSNNISMDTSMGIIESYINS